MFIVLSLFILFLFLMGYVPASFSRAKGYLLEQVALTIGVGILINYCLMLTGQTIARVFAAGTILALWGVLGFVRDLRIRPIRRIGEYNKTTVFSVLCISYILVVYYFEILSEPLLHSDARFIWFFHARMIWAEGALRRSGGWNHPSLAFSNPDYPELVPAIAAQLGYLKGYWNEFLPKGSLLVMLVPLTLWVFSFCQKSLSFIWLVLIFFFSLGAWLWNGYMDGYLALYCGVALLLFGRYLSERRDMDLYSGICALGIGASMKNEGLLFGLCVMAALLFISREYREFSPRAVCGAHPSGLAACKSAPLLDCTHGHVDDLQTGLGSSKRSRERPAGRCVAIVGSPGRRFHAWLSSQLPDGAGHRCVAVDYPVRGRRDVFRLPAVEDASRRARRGDDVGPVLLRDIPRVTRVHPTTS